MIPAAAITPAAAVPAPAAISKRYICKKRPKRVSFFARRKHHGCHCEPVTDVTGVAIRVPRPRAAGADTLLFRASPQAGVGIRSLNSSSFIEPPPSGGGLLRVASGGVLLSPATKVPKTPLETTFQDFLSALCPVSNLPHVPRVIGFPVYRCRSKGLCHHSFPLPLRCRCLLPR